MFANLNDGSLNYYSISNSNSLADATCEILTIQGIEAPNLNSDRTLFYLQST
jgi:hypothetical protein